MPFKNTLITTEHSFESLVYLIEIKGGPYLRFSERNFFYRPEVNKTDALNHYFAVESEVNKVTT